MGFNNTPRGVRTTIAFFGRTNAGKSSLINSFTQQDIAIVSSKKGTTTDPVYKQMEILPIGPCELIDTAGLDDTGELGQKRIKKTNDILNKADVAIYVLDASREIDETDEKYINEILNRKITLVIALNKSDIGLLNKDEVKKRFNTSVFSVSSLSKEGIEDLKQYIANLKTDEDMFKIAGDILQGGDIAVLVTPIDKAAPKGRLILPQQQVIRDILESDAVAIVTKEHELRLTLESLKTKPKIVITDSQAFLKVSADTPRDVMLTSFSILFARYKGDLAAMVKGAMKIKHLKDGDRILIAESCTHHQQSDDIGRVKIPRWLREISGKRLEFSFLSGCSLDTDLSEYALIVHCGGCMLNRNEMKNRIESAKNQSVPITNYGVLIAFVQGILKRVLEPFPLALLELEDEV